MVCITLIVFLLSCLRQCILPTVLWVDLWSVVVAFPSHTHLIFIVCSLKLLHVDSLFGHSTKHLYGNTNIKDIGSFECCILMSKRTVSYIGNMPLLFKAFMIVA